MRTSWIRLMGMAVLFVAAQALFLLVPSRSNAQGVISPGALGTGTISPAGDIDTWTFSAKAGEAIVVRVGKASQLTGSFTPRIQLKSPSLVVLATANGSSAAEVAVTATSAGTYTILVDDVAGTVATGTYRLTLAKTGSSIVVSPGDEGGLMTNGAMHTGTIDVGDMDVWTVWANIGEAMMVRMGEVVPGAALSPHLRIYSPNGSMLNENTNATAAEVTATAPSTGQFLVVADDKSSFYTGSGAYRLTLAKTGSPVVVSPGDEGGPMTNGRMHTGTIDVGDMDLWSVSASIGEAIVVRMGELTSGASLSPDVRVYGPDGTLLGENTNATAAEVAVSAVSTGTYLVVVADKSSFYTGSGTYRLTLAKTGSPVVVSPGDEGGAMINGVMHTGNIEMGDLDLWTVSANVGEAIVVRMGETTSGSPLSPHLRIYGPDGTILGESILSSVAEVAVSAASTGTYLVVADDKSSFYTGTGAYRLTLAKTGSPVVVTVGDEGGPMTNGALHTGTIDVGDLDLWTVTADVGEAIVVRMGKVTPGNTLSPDVRIYGPDGVLMGEGTFSTVAEMAVSAQTAGTYLVVASDRSSFYTGSGAYRLTLAKTGSPVVVSPGDEGGLMTKGSLHTGTIDVGDLDLWTVSADVGEAIVVRMGKVTPGNTLSPDVRIYSPDGVLMGENTYSTAAEVAVSAQTAGTYLVIASDRSSFYTGSGAYRLTLAKTGSTVVISPGDEGGPLTVGPVYTGTIDVGDLDVWTVPANITDSLVVTMEEVTPGSSLSPYVRIYGPTGSPMKSGSGTAMTQVTMVAPAQGTFLVVVGDLSTFFTGSGAYRLTLGRTGGAIVGTEGPARALAFAAPWPNPARGDVNLEYQIPTRSQVRADVMDLSGRRVFSMSRADVQAGAHRVTWDGRDAAGSQVASGVYLARLTVGAESRARRIVLVR